MTFSLAIYGDSISSGTHGEGAYHRALVEAGADPLYVHAVGGSPLARSAPHNLVDVLADSDAVHPGLDVAVVWHGSNDWYWGSPLGDDGTADPETYRGAWCHCVRILRGAAPGVRIIAPTPLWRWEAPHGGDVAGDASIVRNGAGHTLLDYRRVLHEVAEELDLMLVPMGRLTGFCADNADLFYEDRVHPNAAGYARISSALVKACVG